MNFLVSFLGLLPTIFKAATAIYTDVHSNDHKQAVKDGLQSAADAVAQIAPQHAQSAQDAATAAQAVADGVYKVLADVKGTTAPAAPAATQDAPAPAAPAATQDAPAPAVPAAITAPSAIYSQPEAR